MVEIIGLILGGIFRLIPEGLKIFNASKEAKHELAMTELQLRIDQARATQALDLAHANSDSLAKQTEIQGWIDTILKQATPTGDKWVDRLSASVRPVLAYWHCLVVYTAYKAILIAVAIQEHAALASFAGIVMTDWDRAIVGSIFSFWYVDRSIRK